MKELRTQRHGDTEARRLQFMGLLGRLVIGWVVVTMGAGATSAQEPAGQDEGDDEDFPLP